MEILSNIIRWLSQLSKRAKATITVGIVIIISGIVAWVIYDNIQKQAIIDDVVALSAEFKPETPSDPLNAPLRQVFGDSAKDRAKGLYLGNSDVEVVARDGDWLAIRVISLDMSTYGDQYYAIYTKVDGQYRAATASSLIDRADFQDWPEEYTIPSGIFDAIQRHSTSGDDSKLRAILANSPDKKYPIISALPITSDFFKITYAFEDQTDVDSFYLYVDALTGYNNAAINRLFSAGFDPGDYRIVFNHDLIMSLGQ